jgi:hypothetical protein
VPVLPEDVASRFALGRPAGPPVPVTGGLSNELWRLVTERGTYAVKRMVTNAHRPDFRATIEAAYAVERRAWAAGVPMPEPVPDPATGRAVAPVGGSLVRVHRWVGGTATAGSPADGAALLATIHAAGRARRSALPEPAWDGDRWGAELGALARRVARAPERVLVVDSHRDLDPKNTLRGDDGVLRALDWDAAGPVCAVQEAVAVALDFSGGQPGAFRTALRAYEKSSALPVPREPWVFGGWVAAQGGWLDHQAGVGGPDEDATRQRLRGLAATLGDLLDAAGRAADHR